MAYGGICRAVLIVRDDKRHVLQATLFHAAKRLQPERLRLDRITVTCLEKHRIDQHKWKPAEPTFIAGRNTSIQPATQLTDGLADCRTLAG